MKEIVRLFPIELKQKIISKTHHKWDTLQEIRLRLGQPIELIFDQDVEWIRESRPTPQDYMFILNQLSEFSLYRMEDRSEERRVGKECKKRASGCDDNRRARSL